MTATYRRGDEFRIADFGHQHAGYYCAAVGERRDDACKMRYAAHFERGDGHFSRPMEAAFVSSRFHGRITI